MEIFPILINIFSVLLALLAIVGIFTGSLIKAIYHWKYLKEYEGAFEGENSFVQSFFRFRSQESLELCKILLPFFKSSQDGANTKELLNLKMRIKVGLFLFWGGILGIALLDRGYALVRDVYEGNPKNMKIGVMDFSKKKYRKQITTAVKREDLERLNFPDGEQLDYYSNGVISQRATFIDGFMHGTYKTWNSDGVLMKVINYDNGIMHGPYIEYYENGQPCFKVNFSNSLWHGSYELYYKNGQLYEQSNWDHGYPHGEFTIYHKNGQPHIKGIFNKGHKIGYFEYFDKKGK